MPELGSPDGPAQAGAQVRGAVAVVIGGVEANPLSTSVDFSELSMWRFNSSMASSCRFAATKNRGTHQNDLGSLAH